MLYSAEERAGSGAGGTGCGWAPAHSSTAVPTLLSGRRLIDCLCAFVDRAVAENHIVALQAAPLKDLAARVAAEQAAANHGDASSDGATAGAPCRGKCSRGHVLACSTSSCVGPDARPPSPKFTTSLLPHCLSALLAVVCRCASPHASRCSLRMRGASTPRCTLVGATTAAAAAAGGRQK